MEGIASAPYARLMTFRGVRNANVELACSFRVQGSMHAPIREESGTATTPPNRQHRSRGEGGMETDAKIRETPRRRSLKVDMVSKPEDVGAKGRRSTSSHADGFIFDHTVTIMIPPKGDPHDRLGHSARTFVVPCELSCSPSNGNRCSEKINTFIQPS
ncbi:hypothetical protein HMN09_00444900 [Mycena chlorophos]|uniref:Uncharacterized protein n=1 Tax=Mycena chlorophos TaxID=658473 RepID=A0A8H6WGS3_MYCCL|nr:hypothetical protein HMN09_00444900 [Mycena chlorophos]